MAEIFNFWKEGEERRRKQVIKFSKTYGQAKNWIGGEDAYSTKVTILSLLGQFILYSIIYSIKKVFVKFKLCNTALTEKKNHIVCNTYGSRLH